MSAVLLASVKDDLVDVARVGCDTNLCSLSCLVFFYYNYDCTITMEKNLTSNGFNFIFLNFCDRDIVNLDKNLMLLLCFIYILQINILIAARDKKLIYLVSVTYDGSRSFTVHSVCMRCLPLDL